MMGARQQRGDPSQRGGIISSLIATVAAIFLIFLLYLVRHPVFRMIGEAWVVEDTLERADALIVLSDDNYYADRATRADRAHLVGYQSWHVLFSRASRLIERPIPRMAVSAMAPYAHPTRIRI